MQRRWGSRDPGARLHPKAGSRMHGPPHPTNFCSAAVLLSHKTHLNDRHESFILFLHHINHLPSNTFFIHSTAIMSNTAGGDVQQAKKSFMGMPVSSSPISSHTLPEMMEHSQVSMALAQPIAGCVHVVHSSANAPATSETTCRAVKALSGSRR